MRVVHGEIVLDAGSWRQINTDKFRHGKSIIQTRSIFKKDNIVAANRALRSSNLI